MQSKYLASDLKDQSSTFPAKIVTRDGNEYIVNKGTIRTIKATNSSKKLSPAKLKRKLKRANELNKLKPTTNTINTL